MTTDELLFFNTMPKALPLYEILRDKLLSECPDITLKVQKSQLPSRHDAASFLCPCGV